jgi:hypothetical protein
MACLVLVLAAALAAPGELSCAVDGGSSRVLCRRVAACTSRHECCMYVPQYAVLAAPDLHPAGATAQSELLAGKKYIKLVGRATCRARGFMGARGCGWVVGWVGGWVGGWRLFIAADMLRCLHA